MNEDLQMNCVSFFLLAATCAMKPSIHTRSTTRVLVLWSVAPSISRRRPFPLVMAARGGSARSGEGRASEDPAVPSVPPSAVPGAYRETVLGNCARCGSSDRLKFCSRCQVVRYCSPDCQKSDVREGNKIKQSISKPPPTRQSLISAHGAIHSAPSSLNRARNILLLDSCRGGLLVK